MKKTITTLAFVFAAALSANAATVTLTAGFGAGSGIKVTTDDVQTAYSVEVGSYVASNFVAFPVAAIGKAAGDNIAGSFVYTGPDTNALTGKQIFVRITTGSSFAILSTSVTELFPDLTQTLPSNSVTLGSSSAISIVGFGGDATDVEFSTPNNINFTVVPEPSVALLGALGALGLIRRRR